MSQNKAIGIFDSGFGGLNIMQGIVKQLPEYDFVYLGDTARVPYGNRSKDVIYEFTRQAVDFLFNHGCELIIFACNTASSDALRRIQQEYVSVKYPGKNVLGVLVPAAEEAIQITKNNRIGVMATAATVSSGAFNRELFKINSKVKIFQQTCPLLVPIVEAGEQNSPIAILALKKYLKPLKEKGIDTLILGCTHYGILEKQIRKIMGKKVTIISEAKVVPKKLKNYLTRHPEMDTKLDKNGQCQFYSTDITENFNILGSKFFGQKITVKKAELA